MRTGVVEQTLLEITLMGRIIKKSQKTRTTKRMMLTVPAASSSVNRKSGTREVFTTDVRQLGLTKLSRGV
jgi:hypothetical protein